MFKTGAFKTPILSMRKLWLVALIVCVAIIGTASTVIADNSVLNPTGEPYLAPNPISTLPQAELMPRVAYASLVNQYLVVWKIDVNPPDTDIYAIRVNDLGIPIGSTIYVGVSARMDTYPDVAYNFAAREYLVVWENEYSSNDHDIFAQRINEDGTLAGTEIHVSYSADFDSKPKVAFNPSTFDYLVTFQRLINPGEMQHWDVEAVRLDTYGNPYPGVIPIATGPYDDQNATVACDDTNYLIAWQGDAPIQTDIYGQRVAADGSLLGGPLNIATWEGDQTVPRLAYDYNDLQYLAVWEDHHFSPSEIYATRLDTNGNLLGSQIGVALGGSKNRTDPDVAYVTSAHSFLVVWQYEFATYDHDIYSRRIAYDGSHPDPEQVVTYTGAEEMLPALASNLGQQALITWQDTRNGGFDIYGSLETVTLPIFSGGVYQGNPGDLTTPIPGVLVELGCSNGMGQFGTWLASSTTDINGQYSLPASPLCEYYNLRETDPNGYYSIAATSPGGVIYTSNWIYYTSPLQGLDLTNNLFFDQLQGPGDTTPPGNWTNFWPPDWVNIQVVNASEQVEDTYSGLDISTAAYQYSMDGGATWSGWQPAFITGYDGVTTPQTISALVYFGQDSGPNSQNLVQFRVADMAGNMGNSAQHPVKIDSVPPTNPAIIFSPSHNPSVWSNNQYITIQWTGATDDRSGINGYSTSFNQDPNSIPDEYRDTIDPYLVNYAYLDSSSWWFHVRTLDNAGNAAPGAVHYGPFFIDATPPLAWIVTPAGPVNQLTTYIEWGGGDNLSGVSIFDVDVYQNGGWTDWVNTSSTGEYYTGVRGQDAYFRVRATDNAGNTGDWSGTVLISFGVDVTARIDNENGVPVGGAEVFRNNEPQGLTAGNGTITIYDALLGDILAARLTVDSHTAYKSHHDWMYGSDISYRTYITTISFDAAGNPQLFTITDTEITQVLVVRRANALVGFSILVSVEWDADSTYLDDLRAGLESASNYLYDVTDGQMMFEGIKIQDNKAYWADADIRVHASNREWPHAGVGGIWKGATEHIYMGRYFDGRWSNSGPWTNPDGFRTFIHEFGHYGLDLFDEYLNRAGGKTNAGCTVDMGTTPVDVRASFMAYQFTATEMCSPLTDHPHNTNTFQDSQRGGPCWTTVKDRYKDTQNPARWTITRPDERGNIMPGPNTLPVPYWMHSQVINNSSGACAPFDTEWTFIGSGLPALQFDTWVEGGDTLYEGLTMTNTTQTAGIITILGAHNGDTIRVSKSCGIGCSYSGQTTAICSAGEGDQQGTASLPGNPLSIQQDPFAIEITTQPSADGTTLSVYLQGTTTFPQVPSLSIWQDGATFPIVVQLSFDGVGYSGAANLDPSLRLSGNILAHATDSSGYTVYRNVAFNIQEVSATEVTWLRSADAHFEIFLQPGSLSGNPAVSIQPTYQVSMQQGRMEVLGNPYQVSTSNGVTILQQPAALNIYFAQEQPNFTPVGLYRWDAGTSSWILVSNNIDLDNQFISAQISELGIYAILGAPSYRTILPIVVR